MPRRRVAPTCRPRIKSGVVQAGVQQRLHPTMYEEAKHRHTAHTDLGKQHLLPGVSPVSRRAKLQVLAAMPLSPHCRQYPCDIGLFDEVARAQLDLFIHFKE